jgi:hypothetical protein
MGPDEAPFQEEEAVGGVRRTNILVTALVLLAGIYTIVSFSDRRGSGPEPLFPDFEAETAAAIYIEASGEKVTLKKAAGGWTVPSEDSLPADPRGVEAILAKVADFSLKDRVSANPGKRSVYQVDTSGVFVSIVGEDGDTTAAFVVGKVGPDYQSSYVRDAWSDDVILTTGYLRSMFDRGEMTWQDRLVFHYKPDEISMITISRGEEKYTLSPGAGGEWHIAAPESSACRQDRATRLVRMLSILRCEDFAGRLPMPAANVDAGDTTLWFATVGGNEHRLAFGSENEQQRVYFVKDDSDIVYLLSRIKVNQLLPSLSEMLPEESGAAE